MVTEAILGFIFGVVRWFYSLVPDWGINFDSLEVMGVNLGQYLAFGNQYFPITLLLAVLGLILVLQVALLIWRGILFVYALLPFKAT